MATITVKRSFEFRKSSGNAKTRYKARRAEKHAQERSDKVMAKKIDVAMSGCSERTLKAISSTDYKMCLRKKPEPDYGAVCLPEVALYAAGYRGNKPVTAR